MGNFLPGVTLTFDGGPWKPTRHLSYDALSFVYHFIAISEFQLEVQSENAHFGSNRLFFCPVLFWNLTDGLEKQQGTSPKPYQALCITSLSYVNSSWSYVPETAKLGFDLWDLDIWPLTLLFCMDITSVSGKNSWRFHDDTMMET